MSGESNSDRYFIETLMARGIAYLLRKNGIDADFVGVGSDGNKNVAYWIALEDISVNDKEKVKKIKDTLIASDFMPKGTMKLDENTVADVFIRIGSPVKALLVRSGDEYSKLFIEFPLNEKKENE